MHLRAHDVDLAAALQQVERLVGIAGFQVVVVDIELDILRENPVGDLE
ncbi:hypothetical protein SDC9_194049 [bioreactor metagenome]|uniref:Uncharacterized protein n=1 Tax=bioreactor metagenome TaxID=1076179 RepID=A0A645IGH3_9ZZZZ